MIPVVGLGSGIGADNPGCGEAPCFLQKHLHLPMQWGTIFSSPFKRGEKKIEQIAQLNRHLAREAFYLTQNHEFFITVGGDHSCAIGSWSGIAEAKRPEGDIGLLWIDAHMDLHTPQTSESGNIHGMPLAALIGHGDSCLTTLLSSTPKLKPENIALIGIRSFESGEAALLRNLNIKTYFMEEIVKRGFCTILEEAVNYVCRNTIDYGISFDLDSIDPKIVSAVGTPVSPGLNIYDVYEGLRQLINRPPLAFELVEYNPYLDPDYKTLQVIEELLSIMLPVSVIR